jgi:hypothetical protein
MLPYDAASFAAGQDAGTRVAACVARLAALELIDDSRWWNRSRHRLMARALIAHAEAMEESVDAQDTVCGASVGPDRASDAPRRLEVGWRPRFAGSSDAAARHPVRT